MSRHNQPISDSAVDDLIARPGVTSVGEGIDEGQRVIIVGVENEAIGENLPGQVEGFPIRYDVEGPASPASAEPPLAGDDGLPTPVAAETTGRYRPIPPGVSIGHADITAGTSSFLASDGDTLYQLSNNHVLAEYDDSTMGDPILQPGPHDGGVEGEDDAGTLAGYVPVEGAETNVDLAWYEPSVDLDGNVFSLDEEPTIEIQDPEIGDEVTFVGRTSGVTTATVDRVHSIVNVQDGNDTLVFTDQFRLDTPLIGGDSGCPILLDTDDGWVPAGIGFAATDTAGYCNYISNVEAASGLTVLPMPDQGNGGEPGEDGFEMGMQAWIGLGLLATWAINRSRSSE